jgi:hypothetical protein
MRAALPLFLILGACSSNFDEQYAQTEKKVRAAEAKLDADMAKEAAKEPGEARNNK